MAQNPASVLSFPEITGRAREVFRQVVEAYLHSGQPVGSKTLAGGGALNLSPASIRSVLADLEGLGLLSHRTPAPAGCRPSRGCACSSMA
jgi:heat-inducible transcriptional repressor